MTPAITQADLPLILPLMLLTGTTLLVMFQTAIHRHHPTAVLLTLLGLLSALGSLPGIIASGVAATPRLVTPLLQIDGWVLYCWLLLLLVALAVVVLAWGYWRDSRRRMEELYILLLCATLGACVLVASRHFASLFLGLELMSIALIAMLGYPVTEDPEQGGGSGPLEAALKYLVLSAVSSAVLLFGMALLYAETGSLEFNAVSQHLAEAGVQGLYLHMGLVLLLAGLGFKLSLVPFHLWTPDVYQGAPLPVTALIATLSKGAVLALLLRFVWLAWVHHYEYVLVAITVLAVVSMLVGNLLALLQDNPKRILAYSSIAHMGYALIAPLLAEEFAIEAMGLYLTAYLLMTLGAFAALSAMCESENEPQSLADLRGSLWQKPMAALVLILMLLSLAGIPLTIGFMGKFYLLGAAVQGGLWLPLAALLLGSVMGLFYYLRMVVVLVQTGGERQQYRPGAGQSALLLGTAALVVWLGVVPGFMLDLLRNISLAGF